MDSLIIDSSTNSIKDSVIEFKNVSKDLGGREVLRSISLKVSKGSVVFIIGKSGTGKSVLLKNLVGLMRPDKGKIFFNGQVISSLDEEDYLEVRKKVSLVFQQPALFDSLTVYENVAYGLRRLANLSEEQIDKRIKKSLEDVGLAEEVIYKMPNQLSYGMQKRLSIARSICLHPEVLLFDEPTTGLDPITTNTINDLILKLSKNYNTTSIIVSHDMLCAKKIADKIFVLEDGTVVETGSFSDLLQSKVKTVKDFLSEVVDAND